MGQMHSVLYAEDNSALELESTS